jgi:predicted Zn-dependent protease
MGRRNNREARAQKGHFMNRNKRCFAGFLVCLLLISCQTVPVTGRTQLQIVPSGQILAMSSEAYRDFLSEQEVIRGTAEARMVNRVGERIRLAVERYLDEEGLSHELSEYRWEFNLVMSDDVNAWAMPGGKVVIYSGMLPVAQDETGLAVVMSHEIAHVVAKHGNERMSQALLTQMGGMAFAVALSERPQQTQGLFMAAYGLGTQVGILLPYSRLQESEADHLGLIFMAMAGYDPRAAVPFWERMAMEGKQAAVPAFLSTHPPSDARIANIRALLHEAMKYYEQ